MHKRTLSLGARRHSSANIWRKGFRGASAEERHCEEGK